MGDFSRKMTVGGGKAFSLSPQRNLIKPLRPIAVRAIPKGILSFTPFRHSWEDGLGFQGTIYRPNNQLRLIDLNSSFHHMQNHNPNFAPWNNNPIIGVAATSNEAPEKDSRRLNQLLSNLTSTQRYRMRKAEEVASLEAQITSVEDEIIMLCQEIDNKDRHSPQIEHMNNRLQEVLSKREKLLHAVGKEKKALDLFISNEQRVEQQIQKQAMNQNIGTHAPISAQSNLNPSPGIGQFTPNINQVQNGIGTSTMQPPSISQQTQNQSQVLTFNGAPQNQSQLWMTNENSGGQSSTPYYWNIVKSKPGGN